MLEKINEMVRADLAKEYYDLVWTLEFMKTYPYLPIAAICFGVILIMAKWKD